ncbi:MAG: hypothetical protein JWO06_3808 [Bacteroidota bacterium]|nr:hypothetical protein [Bacteroidota bacterium]
MITKSTLRNIKTLFFVILFSAGVTELFATTHTITVQNFSFSPDSINASVGDTIVWQWVNGIHTTTSTNIPSGAATWNSSITTAVQTFSYVLTVSGTYRYYCSVHNFTGVIIASGTSSVERVDASPHILIYPKPFTNRLTIDLNASSVFTTNVTVEVYDILGARKYLRRLGDEVVEPFTMDLSDLAQGVYFVCVNNGINKATYKVTKL